MPFVILDDGVAAGRPTPVAARLGGDRPGRAVDSAAKGRRQASLLQGRSSSVAARLGGDRPGRAVNSAA